MIFSCLSDNESDRLKDFSFDVLCEQVKIKHVYESFESFEKFLFLSASEAIIFYDQYELTFLNNFEGTFYDIWYSNDGIVPSFIKVSGQIDKGIIASIRNVGYQSNGFDSIVSLSDICVQYFGLINDINGGSLVTELVDFSGTWGNSKKRDTVSIIVDGGFATSGKSDLKYGFFLHFF